VRDRLLDALGGKAAADKDWQPARLTALFMPDAQLQRLNAFQGALAVAIEDDEEDDTYQIALGLGGASPDFGRARATLELDVDTWIELAQRKLAPKQAMLQGKILIKGDMAFPMGILSSLMAPG
jgi:putative sterol carrier protein